MRGKEIGVVSSMWKGSFICDRDVHNFIPKIYTGPFLPYLPLLKKEQISPVKLAAHSQ